MDTVNVELRNRTRSGRSVSAAVQHILHGSNITDAQWLESYTKLTDQDIEHHLRSIPAHQETAASDGAESVWDFIHERRDGVSKIEAVEDILQGQLESLEQCGYDTGVILQYVFSHSLWKTHPDPTRRNASAWVNTLDSHKTLASAMLYGALAKVSKQRHLRVIEQAWGIDWYANLDQHIKPANKLHAEELGKTELRHLARIATRDVTLADACKKISETIDLRRQRKMKQRDHRDYMTRQDMESLAHWPQKGFRNARKSGSETKLLTKYPQLKDKGFDRLPAQCDSLVDSQLNGEHEQAIEDTRGSNALLADVGHETVQTSIAANELSTEAEDDGLPPQLKVTSDQRTLRTRLRAVSASGDNIICKQSANKARERCVTLTTLQQSQTKADLIEGSHAPLLNAFKLLEKAQITSTSFDGSASCCECCKVLLSGALPHCLTRLLEQSAHSPTSS